MSWRSPLADYTSPILMNHLSADRAGTLMTTEQVPSAITFKQIRQLVAKGYASESKVISAIDGLLGAAMVVTALSFGPVGAVVLAWFDPKSQVMKLARAGAKKIAAARGGDFLERSQRLAATEFLLTYSAFFEALQRDLPNLTKIADQIVGLEQLGKELSVPDVAKGSGEDSVAASIPHPTLSREQWRSGRIRLYADLTSQFLNLIEKIGIREKMGEKQGALTVQALRGISQTAIEIYEARYLELAIEFPQFYVWTSLNEIANVQQLTTQLSDTVAAQFSEVQKLTSLIDIGMKNLAATLDRIGVPKSDPELSDGVTTALHRVYVAEVDKPIIDDRYAESSGGELNYPRKSDIFVPQEFKVVSYVGPEMRLEDEKAWRSIPSQSGIGPFLIRYLQSAYSAETPLLILGHPGSGKSLLTEMIAARLAPPYFHPVRIALRDIKPDTGLQAQLEAQILADTGMLTNWPDFAGEFAANPPLVILDGYDELLQASGRVFADYLTEVQKFQWREALHGRPIRVLVTSRITLIDKAAIPASTTVMRLLDFDESRRQSWIRVWNTHNRSYFAANGVDEFMVPDRVEVIDLARQPLLLLMLALYDSQANQLQKGATVDQSLLYHSLLTRFIRRERSKGDGAAEFAILDEDEQDAQLESDLARLGVAAIGMFNRQDVHISRDELDKDVEYFRLARDTPDGVGRRLTQADLLLGSFFFIHESRSSSGDREADKVAKGPKSFEFLHNTFGEFLAADFLLRQLLDETRTISTLSTQDSLSNVLRGRLQQMPEDLIACLIHTPLHSRPVVFRMLGEWTPHRLRREGRTLTEFLEALDKIVNSQVRELLSGTGIPVIARRDRSGPYRQLPLMGHLAIFTLNLTLVRTALAGSTGFVFDDEVIGDSDGQCRPWDRLTHLWQSWLSVDELVGISAVLTANRQGSRVVLRARETISTPFRRSHLDDIITVSSSLADDVTAGLAGLVLHEAYSADSVDLDDIKNKLDRVGINVTGMIDMLEARSRPEILTRRDGPLANWLEDGSPTNPGWISSALSIVEKFPAVALVHAPVQRNGPNSLANLTRYEAKLIIEFKARHEPRWLGAILGDLIESGNALEAIMRRPAFSPLLWSIINRMSYNNFGNLAQQLQSYSIVDMQLEAETSVALMAFAEFAQQSGTLHEQARFALSNTLLDDPREIMALSDESLDYLSDNPDRLGQDVRMLVSEVVVDALNAAEIRRAMLLSNSAAVARLVAICGPDESHIEAVSEAVVRELRFRREVDSDVSFELLLPCIAVVRLIGSRQSRHRVLDILKDSSRGSSPRRGELTSLVDTLGPGMITYSLRRLTVREAHDILWFAGMTGDRQLRELVMELFNKDSGRLKH